MIVKSLIEDDSKLTLDCAKATLHKDSKVEIEDVFYWNPEVQGAMKLGMIEVVGKPPPKPKDTDDTPEEKKIKYRNVHDSKICFECIKDYADPGQFIHIPESKISTEREIQNAIAWGMIERADGKNTPQAPKASRQAVKIDEFDADDAKDELAGLVKEPLPEVELSEADKKIAKSRSKKTKAKKKAKSKAKKDAKKSDFKPKAISSSGVEDGGDDLYSETKVVDPSAEPKKKDEPLPVDAVEEDPVTGMPRKSKSFGFMDVFEGAQIGKKKATTKESSEDSEGF